MKDVFIVNPKSGKNSQYELIQEIKEHFQGKRIIIEKTKSPEHATFIAKKYALSNEPVHLYVCVFKHIVSDQSNCFWMIQFDSFVFTSLSNHSRKANHHFFLLAHCQLHRFSSLNQCLPLAPKHQKPWNPSCYNSFKNS